MISLAAKFSSAAIVVALLMYGCNLYGKEEKTIKSYQLDEPEKFLMPESLLEISGITFYKGKSDTIYAIQDEQGRLFRLGWGVKKQVNAKFGKQGDYEDVALLNDKVHILKSNGNLIVFPFSDAVYEEVDDAQEWKGLVPPGEYEGMYGDDATGNLYIICKNCEADNSKNAVSGFILHTGDSIYQTGTFQIDVNEIKTFTGKVKRGFRPSAIAKNPVTSEWFIISAINKLLVVTDNNWKIKETCMLNGNTFNQPEGIAFDTGGNLYISNEGDDFSQGNILKFVRLKN
jgi:SdiA-regulated